jgi:predicted RNase H-like HicB family nuclease
MKTVYNAKAPEIPGCYTQGENVEQAMSVARRSELLRLFAISYG